MSNLSKTHLSFDYLKFSNTHFVELFNSLSTRDKNTFKNSQNGIEMNEMFDFLCNVLNKKVMEEKKGKKNKLKQNEKVNEPVENSKNEETHILEEKVENSKNEEKHDLDEKVENSKKQNKKQNNKKQNNMTLTNQ